MRIFYTLFFLLIAINLRCEDFVIKDYRVDVKVYDNGEISVNEEIDLDFKVHRHGIVRKIPLFFKTLSNRNKKLNVYDIKVWGEKFSANKKGNFLYIKIGDGYETFTGSKKYVISYKIYDAIEYLNDLANINLILIGHDWDVEILKGTFYLYFPRGYELKKQDVYFYSGNFEKSIDYVDYFIERNLVYAKIIRPLTYNESVQVSISVPKNLINKSSFLPLKIFLKENKVIFLPVITFLFLFVIWWFFGKDEMISRIVHYKLPDDLNPAVAGYIYNDKADNRDLVSLFFYWAQKGIISIEEVEDPLSIFFSKKDYILRQLKPLSIDAKPFEWVIFSELFPSYVNVVRLSSLKNNFFDVMKRAKASLEDYISNTQLYDKKSFIFRKIFEVSAILIFFAGFYLGLKVEIYWGISFILTALIVFLFSLIMPKKTDYGKKVYQVVSGFKDFLEKVEKNKIEKMLSKNPEYFDDILPYAIALGIADKIANKFSGLFKEPPQYYSYQGKKFESMDNFLISISLIISDLGSFIGSSSESNFTKNGFLGKNSSGSTGGGTGW